MFNSQKILSLLEEQEYEYRALTSGPITVDSISAQLALLDILELKERLPQTRTDTEKLSSFKSYFLKLYQKQISNTFLLKIASFLFDFATEKDFWSQLFPPPVKLVTPDFYIQKVNREGRRRIVANMQLVEEQPFESNIPMDIEHFVYSNGFLFDLRELSSFSLREHISFYSLIGQFPSLGNAIYNHNPDLIALKRHLANEIVYLPSPRTVITRLTKQLRAGGFTVTGEEYATDEVGSAFTEFKSYLHSLEPNLRSSLEQELKGEIAHLDQKECVEIGADKFERKMKSTLNPIFDICPPKSLVKDDEQYGPNRVLNTAIAPFTEKLTPIVDDEKKEKFKAEQMGKQLQNGSELQQNLVSALQKPHTELPVIEILLDGLAHQSLSTCSAVLQYQNSRLLILAIQFYPDVLIRLLNLIATLPEETRTEILKKFNLQLFSFEGEKLRRVVDNISRLPPYLRTLLMQDSVTNVRKLLMNMMKFFPSDIKLVLDILPNKLNELLREKNLLGFNVCMIALISYPAAFEQISKTIVEKSLQLMLLEKNTSNNYNVLMLAAQYQPSQLEGVLKLIPPDSYHWMLTETTTEGYNAPMYAAQYQPTALRPLLTISDNALTSILNQKTLAQGHNILMIAILHQITSLLPLLNLPYGIVRPLLNETDYDGLNALMLATLRQPTCVDYLLQVIPTDELESMLSTRTNNGGYTALMLAARESPRAMKPLFNGIKACNFSEDKLLQILQTTDEKGNRLISMIQQFHPQMLPIFLEFIKGLSLNTQYALCSGWSGRNTLISKAIDALNKEDALESLLRSILKSMTFGTLKQIAILDAYNKLKKENPTELYNLVKRNLEDPKSTFYQALNIKRYHSVFKEAAETNTLKKMKNFFAAPNPDLSIRVS